jgi:hypothetical protein
MSGPDYLPAEEDFVFKNGDNVKAGGQYANPIQKQRATGTGCATEAAQEKCKDGIRASKNWLETTVLVDVIVENFSARDFDHVMTCYCGNGVSKTRALTKSAQIGEWEG